MLYKLTEWKIQIMEDSSCWESKFEPCQYSDKLLNLIIELNKKAKAPVNLLEIKKACYYARKYHGDQKRKSGEPYYSHPLEVAYLFAKYVGNIKRKYYTTDLIITAILHDVIEDTILTKEMILRIFNDSITSGVEDLTRIKIDKKITAGETVELLYLNNKKDILYIKLFDRSHNIKTIDAMSHEKISKILKETIRKFFFQIIDLETINIEKELVTISSKHLSNQQKNRQKLFSFQGTYPLPSLK